MKTLDSIFSAASSLQARMAANSAVSSGDLFSFRAEEVGRGDLPWRIIRYSRVVEPGEFPLLLAPDSFVRPKTLSAHLAFLKKHCSVISLTELVTRIEENEEIPKNTVVLTFDGGHMDNFLNAAPLLLENRFPASFFIPTAYIESNNFFPEDRVALALLVFKQLELPLPRLDYFDNEFKEAMKKDGLTSEITPSSISHFVAAFRRLPQEDKIATLVMFGQTLENVASLPSYEDFMRWSDVRRLVELGFSVGIIGHGGLIPHELSTKAFIEDFTTAFHALKSHNIEMLPYFCFPHGLSAPHALEALGSLKVRFALTLIPEAHPRNQTELPMLLGRTVISEANAFSENIFGCTLWNYRAFGESDSKESHD